MPTSIKDDLVEDLRIAFYNNIEAGNRAMADHATIKSTSLQQLDPQTAQVLRDIIQTFKRKMEIERDLIFHSLAMVIAKHLG